MILCAFEDGTTELRPANCPSIVKPRDLLDVGTAGARGTAPMTISSARMVYGGQLHVWRIVGEKDGVLTGEWQACRVESVDEQIARITRERDEAVAVLRKIASHSATSRWNVERQALTDQDGEPWVHWAEIARDALSRMT